MLRQLEPLAFTALRIVTGFLFMFHGLQKLGVLGGQRVDPLSLLGLASVLETIGGPLIMLGFLTVPTAIILSVEMMVAYYRVHLPRGPWPIQNGGEVAVLFCFLFLLFATRGPGRWSIDGVRRKA